MKKVLKFAGATLICAVLLRLAIPNGPIRPVQEKIEVATSVVTNNNGDMTVTGRVKPKFNNSIK